MSVRYSFHLILASFYVFIVGTEADFYTWSYSIAHIRREKR